MFDCAERTVDHGSADDGVRPLYERQLLSVENAGRAELACGTNSRVALCGESVCDFPPSPGG
jgi:hypothetical protein